MAKESFDPIEVGEAMWKSIAIEAVLYGIQTISVTEHILTKLDSIQATFAADLLQVNRTCSHVGLLRELGWASISSLVVKRKLVYWTGLCSLEEENWARKAFEDCLSAKYPISGSWHSKYRQEIQQLHLKCHVGFILKDGHTPKKNVELSVDKFFKQEMATTLTDHRNHSLKYLPEYPEGMGRQRYITLSESSSVLTKFRLGNANLGNKESPAILVCPGCNSGQNNELHLVFQCHAMDNLRNEPWMQNVLKQASDQERFDNSDNRKLRSFLGGDHATAKRLHDRGTYLSILRQKHLELKEASAD